MKITEKRRRCLVDLSDGEWSTLEHHSDNVKASVLNAGLMRCDEPSFAIRDRQFTITPDGITALEASQ